MKNVLRVLSHFLFSPRYFTNKNIKNFSSGIQNSKILEIGSGKAVNGKYVYSAVNWFDSSNDFTMTDFNPRFGHKIVDLTKMNFKEEYDVIICANVLEHIFDFQLAVDNLYSAVKKRGTVIVVLPFIYPLHDEPNDYWRYSEYCLRLLFSKFESIEIKYSGLRAFPFFYFIKLTK